ncbi:MAG: Maf family nucleotide pyrophosphatase [Candidatus Omnitrophica bacterium]|nr:Maf family nucleotide pyrophosphatase [Candidatus Omnitrophota bacterium]
MTKKPLLILASASPHRRKLLKQVGLKFRVIPSHAEETATLRKGCAHLVQVNALRKAKDVAGRLRAGFVVGADTVVYTGDGKIIGKPRNLKEAKKNLKMLSRKPQWLYSGVAIVDAKTKKTLVGFEKTKVIMTPLTDKEIDNYYRHTPGEDKAGGFDIEGRGALFIKRIEGCYYNVVGLPLAKLREMFKKFGVHILFLFFCFLFPACTTTEYNLATQQQETMLFNTEKEVGIGNSLATYVEQEFEVNTDVDVNARVSRIAKRIEDICDRKELSYSVRVINKNEVNAFSLPGGYIYVYKGLIDKVDNDDELAGVIAHEFGHITAKHAMKRLQASYGYTLLQILSATTGNAHMMEGIDLAFASIVTGYGREDEFQADRLSVKYMKKAGYNPIAMARFLEKLQQITAKEPIRPYTYWRTHPFTSQRIAAEQQELKGVTTFRDYIRLTEEKGAQ